MSLIKLKNYLKSRRLVSLFDLVNCFNVDPDIIRDMLQFLIKKGAVRQKSKTQNCGGKCIKCHPHITELYEWVEV